MSATQRPAKRARQACDPCRRKKSRCPGEKPVCSYCVRLGQRCTYSDDAPSGRYSVLEDGSPVSLSRLVQPTATESREGDDTASLPPMPTYQPIVAVLADHVTEVQARRLNDLETKLAEVIDTLHGGQQYHHEEHYTPVPPPRSSRPSPYDTTTPALAQSTLPPLETLQQGASLYLEYCHSQPLPLFVPSDLFRNISSLDEEVVLAILATSLRFARAKDSQLGQNTSIGVRAERSRSLTMRRIVDGPVEVSTLQSLCLLSWLDFYDGNTHRASMYAALASDICKSSNLVSCAASNIHTQEEGLRCFWSIVLLQRLHPNSSGPFHIVFDEEIMPNYPKSPSRPTMDNYADQAISEMRASEHKDLGIVAYAIQLTEVWYKVARYAHRRASAGPHPPWSSKSEYSKILDHQMHGETSMPYSKHRFKPARFEERTAEKIAQHRDYWGPWLFTQILYHTIICILNHPLLLSLRLRHFRVASIPEIWLQHTNDLISQHSQWVIHLIDIVESKSFSVSDPFLAHCVAIVATIFLQQSFADDPIVQQTKKENFAKCLRFCRGIGKRWKYIEDIAQKLQRFERVVFDSYLNSAASEANDKVFIDLGLFWEILESAAISEIPDRAGLSLGSSLRTESRSSTSTEQLNARLLPKPARVATIGSPTNGLVSHQTPNGVDNTLLTVNSNNPLVEDFSVLAQSYFAQGQDFVGNMDDWWMLDDSANT